MYIELLNLMVQGRNSTGKAVKRIETLLDQDGAGVTLLAIFYTRVESLGGVPRRNLRKKLILPLS